MALGAKQGVTGAEGLRSRLEVQDTDGTWHRLRGASDMGYDAGERDSNSIQTYDGAFTILGGLTIGDFRGTIDAWTPNVRFWQILREAKEANLDMLFRLQTPPASTILAPLAGRTATIKTADGAFAVMAPAAGAAGRVDLDLLFAGPVIQVGHVVRVQGDAGGFRTFEDLQVDPDVQNGAANRWTAKVLPRPAADIAAGTFIVQRPQYQVAFLAGVKKLGSISLPVSGALGTELILTPNQELDLPSVANSASPAP